MAPQDMPGTPRTSRRGARGISYQELLDADTHPVPDSLRRQQTFDVGSVEVPVERYFSPEFFKLEVEKVWKRAWQMACHEDDIPNVGDHLIYDIADLSFVVVRVEPNLIKAYYNACLHRGRQLRECGGQKAVELRCPFHGFAWNLDGTLRQVTCQWEFPDIKAEEWSLPEAKVGRWAGFVFINPDTEAEPFESFLGSEVVAQFDRWRMDERYKQAHVAKVLRCNWKVAQEAFMEAFHVIATHPQLLPASGDVNSQYDAWGNVSRAVTPGATPSPHLGGKTTEQEIMDAISDRRLDDPEGPQVPPGQTARQFAAEGARETLRPAIGDFADELSDSEMMDSIYYTVFPNFHPWGAYNRIVYRFRPLGMDPDQSVMECLFMSPYVGEKPPPAPIHWIGADESWDLAPELGVFAQIFKQDSINLPKVQIGLKTMKKKTVTLARYQESKIRHFQQLLAKWMERP